MKYFFLALRLLVLLFLIRLFLFILSDAYTPAEPGFRPPFSLVVLDWINLFIHEAGHFFFAPFGRTVNLLGGSIMQLLIPAAAIAVWTLRDRLNAHYFLFWMGESAVNVSVYIADAPYRRLRLISSGALHDWSTVLGSHGMLDSAGTIGTIVNAAGVVCMGGAIIVGIVAAVYQFRNWQPPPIPD